MSRYLRSMPARRPTDIRYGCGGLCDDGEPCPMRGNVERCTCGAIPVHGREQHDFVLRQTTDPMSRLCSICGGETEHDADAHAEEGEW
jgi:hypothetical protein